ncbi:hypothetical protein J2W32_001467 [Variovorax boronicumulans]|uniref:Uncharacterized protein n=1 Tax=Variovorax boronicumulans TaxID=436515 RepID=A0AAW8CXG8_9BURK|nr:hypothetical protein [Variovorax boronicumulans]MDP9893228.1 hypothetical protein [Variovorax boronicumulans]MDQ0052425.1 hypothetical protein [Variovorax boronicumulans]
MKKPVFSFKAAIKAAARKGALSVANLLPSAHWAFLGLGKKKAAAPPSASAAAASPAVAARPPVAKKTAPAATPPSPHGMADEDEETLGTGPMADARRRERARCEAIVCSPAGLKNPVLAKTIAFESRMARKEGIALLESAPLAATADSRNLARADRNPRIGVHPSERSMSQNTEAARMHGALAAEMARTNAARGRSVQAEAVERGSVA